MHTFVHAIKSTDAASSIETTKTWTKSYYNCFGKFIRCIWQKKKCKLHAISLSFMYSCLCICILPFSSQYYPATTAHELNIDVLSWCMYFVSTLSNNTMCICSFLFPDLFFSFSPKLPPKNKQTQNITNHINSHLNIAMNNKINSHISSSHETW